MRNFFKSELENLHIKTGSQQLYKLKETEDENGNNVGDRQIKFLLDMLEQVVSEFAYIPDNDKKRIIQQQIMRDQKFVANGGLTPHFVWHALNLESRKYFKEEAHKESQPRPDVDMTPKTFDELSPDLQTKVNELLNELQQPSKFKMPEITQADIDIIKAEDEIKAGQQADEYTLEDFERQDKLYRVNKKIEYGRLFSDPNSFNGELLPGSPEFEKWLKDNP